MLQPANAVSIIECDMNVDFEAPPGYEEPRVAPVPMEEEEPELDISQMLPEQTGFLAFAGSGNRLDGKKKRTNSESEVQERQQRGANSEQGLHYECQFRLSRNPKTPEI